MFSFFPFIFLYELCLSIVLPIPLKKDCHRRQKNRLLERRWDGTEHLEKLMLLCAAVVSCITAHRDALSPRKVTWKEHPSSIPATERLLLLCLESL